MTETLPVTEDIEIPYPDISHLITEDDEPVDSIFSEKQMRLLTEPLFAGWGGPSGEETRTFVAMANVGLFYTIYEQAIVPDVLVSVDVKLPANIFEKRHRSYFIWEYGKPPDVVIEVVSNRKGEEDGQKLERYSQLGVPYYIIYDPEQHLSDTPLRVYVRNGRRYRQVEHPIFPDLDLGLTLWEGVYEDMAATWLRWTDSDGNLIPTGAELAQAEHQRAEAEHQRAEAEKQRAERERQRADHLAARLRELGIDPDEDISA